MSLEPKHFEFGDFVFDSDEMVLLQNGEPVPLTPKALKLLDVLVKERGHIVEKQALMDAVWTDSFVEESNLTYTVRLLRKALGDEKANPRFVETVPRRGYRFVGFIKENGQVPPVSLNNGTGNLIHNRDPRPVFYSILFILLGVSVLTAGYFALRGSRLGVSDAGMPTDSRLRFEAVTSSGKSIAAAISPDGKYIAYTNIANGQQSLWLRQLSSGINTQIVAPVDDVLFYGVEFSRDSEQIYFVRGGKNEPTHLDRVSILGGAVKTNILTGLKGGFNLSPDNSTISFVVRKAQKSNLMIAETDGSNIRQLFSTPNSQTITDNAVSPDGKRIAFASGQSDTGNREFGVYTIDPANGDMKAATNYRWYHVKSVLWLADQSGLLVTARIKDEEPQQVWEISLSDGAVNKITDTQNVFDGISATADLSLILLTQISLVSGLYVGPYGEPDKIQPIAPAAGGVAWMPDGKLVFSSRANGNSDIWMLDAERTNLKQLTTETSAEVNPQVSPSGRHIVFVSDRGGKNSLWRVNVDGTDPVQLTHGDGENAPVLTPDGAFVVFNSMRDLSLWKVPIEGGEAIPVSEKHTFNVAMSPDGTKFAHFSRKDGKPAVVVKSFSDGVLLQEFIVSDGYAPTYKIIWTQDGSSLIYTAEDTVYTGNLWLQSLQGRVPKKITDYASEEIFDLDLSPDGSELALIRGSWQHDVVLLRGFKSEKARDQ